MEPEDTDHDRADSADPAPHRIGRSHRNGARGELEQAQQQYDAALRDFDDFSKRAPRNPRGLIGRGAVLEATGQPKEALQAYENAVALEPSNAQALTARDRLRSAQNAGDQTK